MTGARRRVAVVGAGISGLATAWHLAGHADVVLFEADNPFGGHAHTVDLPLKGVTFGVDTGVLVFNHATYPGLVKLFAHLQVEPVASEMSFLVPVPKADGASALEWSSSHLDTVFAQRSHLFKPRFLRRLRDLVRFNRSTTTIAEGGEEGALQQPIGDFLIEQGDSDAFRDGYLLPMLGCIWSCPTDQKLRFTDWHGQHVWLIGASTGNGRATAALLHRRGAQVTLSARSAAALDAFVAEHLGAQALALDATDADAVHAAAQRLLQQHGRIDLAMYCAGHYRPLPGDDGDGLRPGRRTAPPASQRGGRAEPAGCRAAPVAAPVLPPLLRQAAAGAPAHLSLVASVAGYRGLPNALAYGPTKAALINLAEVLYLYLYLYLYLHARGASVSLINPGFVETPLTAQNSFHMPALITPEAAAEAIVAGWEKGEFEIHFPKRFTRLLKAMRQLPDRLYFGAVRRVVRA